MENKKDPAQMYEILKNKKVLETKLRESPVRSAKHVSGLPKKQVELEGHLFLCIEMRSLHGLAPTRITNLTRIPDILPTTKNSVVLVVDCIRPGQNCRPHGGFGKKKLATRS